MSCDWDVRCIDCSVNHGFDDANHQSELMVCLARLGPKLADMAVVIREIEASSLWMNATILLGVDRWRLDFAWFATHGAHRLVAVDEYGHCFDECGEDYSCEACQHRATCRRQKGHEGPHNDDRDST